MLKISSVPNEYYCGDLPGTIQYNKKREELILAGNQAETINNETGGYVVCEHSVENLNRVVPHTKKNVQM